MANCLKEKWLVGLCDSSRLLLKLPTQESLCRCHVFLINSSSLLLCLWGCTKNVTWVKPARSNQLRLRAEKLPQPNFHSTIQSSSRELPDKANIAVCMSAMLTTCCWTCDSAMKTWQFQDNLKMNEHSSKVRSIKAVCTLLNAMSSRWRTVAKPYLSQPSS